MYIIIYILVMDNVFYKSRH